MNIAATNARLRNPEMSNARRESFRPALKAGEHRALRWHKPYALNPAMALGTADHHSRNGTYLRHGWQPRAERVVEGLPGFLLQVEVSQGCHSIASRSPATTLTGPSAAE
jgi:hypothetical protein